MLTKSKLLTSEQLAHAQDTVLLTSNAEDFSEILVDEGFLTPWQASQLLAGQTEFFIGNYVLLELLGRGGMGHVFLARHKTMQRQVALKIISRKVGKDPASRERFLSEARAAALLDHPNIVRAFDVDKDRERFYIIMEYVAGQDLEGVVQQEGPLDFEFIVDCIRQAAEGLEHAHRRNLVHCDIKPSNLLLTETGTVKILDMGMARLLNQSAEDSGGDREGRIPGTVDYMAPEQAMEGPDFDHRADIYALGCTMYFLLTGGPPFNEGSLAGRIIQHQTQPPPDILALRPDTPRDLARICLKMMAKSPADRFQSADELAKTLAQWRPPAPASPAPATAAKPTSTGVAIDEEDFKPSPAMQPLAGRSKSTPKGILADERRLILWMAGAAVVLGGLLVVVAVFFATRSGGTEDQPPAPPAPRAHAGETEHRRPAAAPDAPGAPPEQHTAASPPEQPAAQPAAPSVEPTKQAAQRRRRRRPTPQARPQPAEPGLTESGGLTASSALPDTPPLTVSGSTGAGSSTSTANPLANVTPTPPAPGRATRPADPLRDLPGTIELPPRSEAGREVVLGRSPLAPGEKPAVELLGGESAVKAPARLLMEADPTTSRWLVRLVDAGGGQTDVARFSLRGEEIVFAWLNAGEGAPAEALRNCLLEVRVGQSSRIVRLLKPGAEAPLTLELAKGTAEKRLPAGETAEGTALRLAVTGVDGLPGNSRMKEVVLEPGEQKEIRVFRQGGCALVLKAKYGSQRAGRSVHLTTYYQLATRSQPTRLSASKLPGLLKQKLVLEGDEQRIALGLTNPRLSESQKKSRTAELKKKQGELKWLNEFLDWCQASGGVLHVHFQEFIAIGKHRVVLLDTRLSPGEPPPAAPAAPAEPTIELNPVESGGAHTFK